MKEKKLSPLSKDEIIKQKENLLLLLEEFIEFKKESPVFLELAEKHFQDVLVTRGLNFPSNIKNVDGLVDTLKLKIIEEIKVLRGASEK
jgi:hypothetical protein